MNTQLVYIKQLGFTLVEMMVAMVIGLLILAALSSVAINSGKSTGTNDKTAELQSVGRYAIDVLRRDIQHSGQTGLTPPSGLVQAKAGGFFTSAVTPAIVNDCRTGFALELENPIEGGNDAITYPACIPTSLYDRGDVLVVRYADMTDFPATPNVAPTLAQVGGGEVYFRSTYTHSGLYKQGGVVPLITGSPMQDQLLRTYVYFISRNTVATDGVPALYRLALNAGRMSPELVIGGIENMQIQYGVVDATSKTQFKNADVITANNEWGLVNSVRVWLLARNETAEVGENYSNTTTYTMGDINYVPVVGTNDKFRRQLYSTTIQLRNRG